MIRLFALSSTPPSLLRHALRLSCALVASTTFMTSQAHAYSSGTVVSDACHERMTQDALRAARTEFPELDKVPANADERALINDLPFQLDADMRDLGAASLVLGNRDNDFHGHQVDELDRLAPLHGTPALQREHCLRTPSQDGVSGSREALLECRAFIQEHAAEAFSGLGSDGAVNPEARTTLSVPLDIRGPVDVSLPTYHVQLGRALHAVQDGFSHTYRSADHRQVVSVLNYIELVEDSLDQNVDGPAHSSELDDCKSLDAFRQERLDVANQASEELLRLSIDPELNQTQKLAMLDEFLDTYFSHADGCSAENGYCEAPERRYKDAPTGCQLAKGASTHPWPMAGVFILGALLLLHRRRRNCAEGQLFLPAITSLSLERRLDDLVVDEEKRPHLLRGGVLPRTRSTSVMQPGALVALGSLLIASPAHAAEEVNSADPNPAQQPVTSQVVAREDARIAREPGQPWGIAVNFSGSLKNPALAGAVGARYRVSENWLVGADLEHNPWYAEGTSRFRPGVTSAYASVILRFPMRFERTNLRSTLQLGASRMMFDLYGVPEGTIGPYVGFTPLGIDYELGSQVYLVVDPAHVAIPVPQTTGAPFSYTQYRITVGLQLGS